jgi:hypothetical protein
MATKRNSAASKRKPKPRSSAKAKSTVKEPKQSAPAPTPVTASDATAASAPEPTQPRETAGTESSSPHSSPSESKTAPADILKGFAKSSSRIVQKAASILEEEIAAGILAAKQVEERLINVREIRSANPEEVMQRFRRDAHEVVDIVLDVVNAATNSVADLAERAVSIRSVDKSGKASRAATGGIPTLTVAEPVKAGESAEISMAVENDSDKLTADFSFHSSDLLSSSGHLIPAAAVHFTPTKLSLPPHGGERLKVTLQVPSTTPPGTYASLIQATNLSQFRAVLSVQVC